ncbi:MAG: hypothetical protein ACKOCW_09140 [Planctomycetaceae bacterium]
MARSHLVPLVALVSLATLTQSGCFWLTAQGPNIGPLAIPIPVPVYVQKQKEDQFWNYERYERTPVSVRSSPAGRAKRSTSRATTR